MLQTQGQQEHILPNKLHPAVFFFDGSQGGLNWSHYERLGVEVELITGGS